MNNNKNFYYLLLVATLFISSCAVDKIKDDAINKIPATADETKKEIDPPQKPVSPTETPGMIYIERHSKEYSISMILDATDENIQFVMDLPEDESHKDNEEEDEQNDIIDDQEASTTTNNDDPDKREKDDDQADKNDNKLAEKNPQQKANLSSKHILYAQSYFFENKYTRALHEINRALEYSPDLAIAYSLKGSIHFKKGESQKARLAWTRALELDPTLDNVKTMLDELDG